MQTEDPKMEIKTMYMSRFVGIIFMFFPPRRSRLLDARGRSQDGDRGKKSKVLGSRARFKVSSMPAHISLGNIKRKKHKYTITRIACQAWLELTH